MYHRVQIASIVQVLSGAAHYTLRNQADYLLEFSPLVNDTDFREATQSVPTTNQKGESDFALLRMIKENAPRMKSTNVEARVKIKRNKPVSDFLNKKSEEERATIMLEARKSVKNRELQVKEIEHNYRQGLQNKREQRIASRREKEENQGKKNLEITRRWCAAYGNIWKKDEVDEKLEGIHSEKAKLDAVNLLIEYFLNICNATSSQKEVFLKSKNRQAFTFSEKREHLNILFKQNPYLFSAPSDIPASPPRLDITWEADAIVKKIQAKSAENDQKRLVKNSKQLLSSLNQDPSQLLCRKFMLKRVTGGETHWTQGRILRLLGIPRKNRMFAVRLAEEEEEQEIAILYEIKKGNVALLPPE